MTDNNSRCIICDKELTPLKSPTKSICMICGNDYESNCKCSNGHCICDECKQKRSLDIIIATCSVSQSKNPIEIMQHLMNQPAIPMLGPEHHVMVGASLLTAYHNCGGNVDLDSALKDMRERGSMVPFGSCGSWGCCGAAISVGMFISIITKASPMSSVSWGFANQMTALALTAIGDEGGPGCCKRDSFFAIKEAVLFVKEIMGIKMELSERIKCTFSEKYNKCKGVNCPFHKNTIRV